MLIQYIVWFLRSMYFWFFPVYKCECCGSDLRCKYDRYKFKSYLLCYVCSKRADVIFNVQMYKYLTREEYLTNNIVIDYIYNNQ